MSDRAGPKLDEAIATRLGGRAGQAAPKYSTDIAAAWQLVGWLQITGFEVALVTTSKEEAYKGRWTCAVGNGVIGLKSSGDTAPLAISRAVLSLFKELERDRDG